MRVNVEKVLERDQKLSELDNRAGNGRTAEVVLNLLRILSHILTKYKLTEWGSTVVNLKL